MTELQRRLLNAIETHSIEEIAALLKAGLDPRTPVRGKSPVTWLTEMYTRSDRFPECLRLFLNAGGALDNPELAPFLLDDSVLVAESLRRDPLLIDRRTSMASAFTPLVGATPLHVACEYGNLNAVRTLLEMGADANSRAAVDEFGLDGHTPIFHTVNSNANRSQPLLCLLLEAGASCDIRLPGITWGKGFEWETTCFDVTPVSYAQLGLLPQMHRDEMAVYANVRILLEASGRAVPPLNNVPNQYLRAGNESFR